jgi:hypothetical protein
VTGAIGYKLDVATDPAFTAFLYNGLVVTGSPTPPTFTTVSGLTSPGTTYSGRAYNSVGDSGNSSAISTTAVPSPPTATAASGISGYAFQANWNAQTGASYYKLYVCTDFAFSTCVSDSVPLQFQDLLISLRIVARYDLPLRLRASATMVTAAYQYSIACHQLIAVLGGPFTTVGAVNDNSMIAPFSESLSPMQTVTTCRITYAVTNGPYRYRTQWHGGQLRTGLFDARDNDSQPARTRVPPTPHQVRPALRW